MRPLSGLAPRRGRPRKFSAPSRAVTLTLPESVLATLSAIDADLSRAVVRVVQPRMARRPQPPAELVAFGARAVIVVNPTRTLEERTGVLLVPLSDGRALISFDETMTAARLELGIEDALEDRRLTAADRAIFAAIREILKTARRSGDVSVHQRNIIVLESRRVGKRPAPRRR
jgi:hypothetical protein